MDQAMLHLYTKKSNEYLQVDLGFSMGVLGLFTYDSQTKLTSEVPQDNSFTASRGSSQVNQNF